MKNAGRMKITLASTLITLAVGAPSYSYRAYLGWVKARAELPRAQCGQLIADLRRFRRTRSRFPDDLREVAREAWKGRHGISLGGDGRSVRAANYGYYYTRIGPDKCVFWALPAGPRRAAGKTFFVVVTAGWERTWEGAAISERQFDGLPAVPSLRGLLDAGLSEVGK